MSFLPRQAFPAPSSLPRSYFLGHHHAGLNKMKSLLTQIDLVIECRDYRVPLSSTNPLFESLLSGRQRIIVFTKRDLGTPTRAGTPDQQAHDTRLAAHLAPSTIYASSATDRRCARGVLGLVRKHARARQTFTGSRVLVVGMPNVGKSTLLNSLRAVGVGKGKAARTGAQPGITRSVATGVKILDGEADGGPGAGGVYLLDTPGVFVPYVPDAETMLKLCLVGCVKDGIVPYETLADYLLFRMNLVDPGLYADFTGPTNEIEKLLSEVARKSGRLGKGGELQLDRAALWLVQKWRVGELGRFVLDVTSQESLDRQKDAVLATPVSIHQAKRLAKEAMRSRSRGVGDTD